MERIPVELIYVLVFLGIVLFNFVMQQAARRRQQQEQAAQGDAQPAEPPQPEPQPDEEMIEDIWGRPPPRAAVIATPAPTAPPARPAYTETRHPQPQARRLHPVRALLTERHDLRRAVVLSMVLGPCRAQEPPDEQR